MKDRFIWLVMVAFLTGLVVLALNIYNEAVQTGQSIEEKLR